MASSSGALGSSDQMPLPIHVHEAEVALSRGTFEIPEGQSRECSASIWDAELSETSEEEMICFTKYEPIDIPGWGQYAIPTGFANLPQIVQHRILGYLRVHKGRKGLRVQIKAAFRADRRERWGIMTASLLKRV